MLNGPPAACGWIKDFLTNRPRVVKIGGKAHPHFCLAPAHQAING